MKIRLLHYIAWTLGVLIHYEGRPLGFSRPSTSEPGGPCGGISTRAR